MPRSFVIWGKDATPCSRDLGSLVLVVETRYDEGSRVSPRRYPSRNLYKWLLSRISK